MAQLLLVHLPLDQQQPPMQVDLMKGETTAQ